MFNTCVFENNKILIEAPGNANSNRIKNDLVWDINKFLSTQYDLYMFFECKKCFDSAFYFRISGVSKKYVVFQELDAVFINRTTLSNDEVIHYRGIMDPHKKMNDEVFREACCLENVDMQYVAIKNVDQFLDNKTKFKSITSFNCWVTASLPVYISLFGSKEMRIIANHRNVLEKIREIVLKHCVESI